MPTVVIPKGFIKKPVSRMLQKPKTIPASPKAAWNNTVNELRGKFPSIVLQMQKHSNELDKAKQALQKQKNTLIESVESLQDLPNGPVKSATMALSLSIAGCYLGMLDGAISFIFEKEGNSLEQSQKHSLDSNSISLSQDLENTKGDTTFLMKDAMQNNKLETLKERHNGSFEKIGDSLNRTQNMSKQINPPIPLIEYKRMLGELLLASYSAGIRDAFFIMA